MCRCSFLFTNIRITVSRSLILDTNELIVLFGKRLAFLRAERKLTQEQLAELSDVSTDLISLIERGKRSPSFTTIAKLSNALSVEISELFEFNNL